MYCSFLLIDGVIDYSIDNIIVEYSYNSGFLNCVVIMFCGFIGNIIVIVDVHSRLIE